MPFLDRVVVNCGRVVKVVHKIGSSRVPFTLISYFTLAQILSFWLTYILKLFAVISKLIISYQTLVV